MQSTNDTSNRFLGSTQRSWMQHGATNLTTTDGANTSTSRSKSSTGDTPSIAGRSGVQNAAKSPSLRRRRQSGTGPPQEPPQAVENIVDLESEIPGNTIRQPVLLSSELSHGTTFEACSPAISTSTMNPSAQILSADHPSYDPSHHISDGLYNDPNVPQTSRVAMINNIAQHGVRSWPDISQFDGADRSDAVGDTSRASAMLPSPGNTNSLSHPSPIRDSPVLMQPSVLPHSSSSPTPASASTRPANYMPSFPNASFEQEIAKIHSLVELGPASQTRIQWIRQALSLKEYFFLLMHQIYCIWFLRRDYLCRVFDLATLPDNSFAHLGIIFGDNSALPRRLIEHFCSIIALEHDPHVRPWLTPVLQFSTQFAQRWNDLILLSQRRGSPPCAREICERLQCMPSTLTLQQLCFRIINHSLYTAAQPDLLRQGEQLFLKDQAVFLQHINRATRWSDDQVHASYRAFHTQYAQIRQRHGVSIVRDTVNAGPTRIVQWSVRGYQDPQTHVLRYNNVPTAINSFAPPSSSMLTPQQSPVADTRTVPGQLVNTLIPLLPREDYRLPILREPDPSTHAVHQAHLWPCTPVSDSASIVESWFAYLDSFLLPPQIHLSSSVFSSWEFDLPVSTQNQLVKLATSNDEHVFSKSEIEVADGALHIRLKCIQLPSDAEVSGGWSTIPNCWPECGFFSINDQHVELQRKLHYKRDLPTDITTMVKAGTNNLQFSYHPLPHELNKQFVIAVESIVISSESTVLAAPASIDAEEALKSIVQSLNVGEGDDDIQLVDDYISIDLTDPFMSQMFVRPARGASCLHRECFDLDTFLQSLKSQAENGVVGPDRWLCPICGRDARPKNLVIDEFLVAVRRKLLEDGQTDVRAIHVMSDGSWTPKIDEATEKLRDSSLGANNPGEDAEMDATTQSIVEVIEL